MYLPGARGQQQRDFYYDYSGSLTSASLTQLILPQSKSRSHLLIASTSTHAIQVQIGIPPGVATLTSGVVTGITYPDAGFGFLAPPDVLLLGGGNSNDPASSGGTMPDWPPPSNVATAVAKIANGTISTITITNGGSGYTAAPFVFISAQRTDPTGVGSSSATLGIPIAANSSLMWNGTTCPTDAISIWGGTQGQTYTVKWMA